MSNSKYNRNIIDRLPRLTRAELLALWTELFGRPPPPNANHNLLRCALAYRLQEQAHGGLRSVTRRRLRRLAEDIEGGATPTVRTAAHIKSGTRFIRQWQGKTHTVTVADDGYVYRSRRYRSLSVIAREITGTRWSGPLFFGLKPARVDKPEHADAR